MLAAVIGLSEASSTDQTIYDPTCGSGSLLLKAHELAYSETGLDLAVYGQENDNATAGLAKMNMILHGVLTAEIAQGNTLSAPQFKGPDDKLQTFDFVVANPPFSTKSWMKGVDVGSGRYKRFEYGTPPPKNGDFAFLLHMLTSLKTTGKAGVVLPHGVLFRGNAEGDIRQELISRGFIKTVIGLPPNLFYGTGIPAAIVVLDKEGADTRTDVFLVDASGGFVKDGPKNRLRERDIHRIIDTVAKRVDVPGFARLVPIAEIADARNDFNLNIPRYVASDGDVDVQDLGGHLHGGIPQRDVDALDSYWSVAPGLRAELFTPASLPGYFELCIPVSDVPGVILNHSQMQAWRADVGQVFDTWEQTHRPALAGIDSDTKPKDLVHGLGESLLKDLATVPLVDSYTVYQSLMEYWASTMRDDVDLVVSQGWAEAAKPGKVTGAEDRGPVDFGVGKERFRSGILPADVLIAAFLSELQEAVDLAAGSLAAASASLEELVDEHGSEGGLLADGLSDSGKVTKKSVADRLKALSGESDVEDELEVLKLAAAALADVESAKKAHKAATDALNAAVKNQYEELDADTVRDLVVDSKWLGRIRGVVAAELARVERGLSERVGVFGERYTAPLPALEAAAETYATVVREHLAGMGVKW